MIGTGSCLTYIMSKLCVKKEKIAADSPVTKTALEWEWLFGSCPNIEIDDVAKEWAESVY